MIVTIDGPAGAGKSLVSRKLAERLGFRMLDTGAMYRAAAWAAARRGVDWNDHQEVASVVTNTHFEFSETAVRVDGDDVTTAIRTLEITNLTRHTANNPLVRKFMVELQRRLVADGDFVTEGRDQGTVVFPNAACKIYLTASPEERARRRHRDLAERGERITFEQVLAQQNERDASDAARDVGPLARAADAIEVLSDGMTPDEVADRLAEIVRSVTSGQSA